MSPEPTYRKWFSCHQWLLSLGLSCGEDGRFRHMRRTSRCVMTLEIYHVMLGWAPVYDVDRHSLHYISHENTKNWKWITNASQLLCQAWFPIFEVNNCTECRDWIDVDMVGDKDRLCAVRLLFKSVIWTNKGQPIISFSPGAKSFTSVPLLKTTRCWTVAQLSWGLMSIEEKTRKEDTHKHKHTPLHKHTSNRS